MRDAEGECHRGSLKIVVGVDERVVRALANRDGDLDLPGPHCGFGVSGQIGGAEVGAGFLSGREVLQSLSDVWEDDFHETVVNGALLERGHQIWLTPAATIYQERGQLGWGEALQERYVWGRSFGGTRVKEVPLSKRLVYAAFCLALPLLLASRAVRIAWTRGSFWSGCLPVLPILLLLFSVWSFGEMVGYLSGRPD